MDHSTTWVDGLPVPGYRPQTSAAVDLVTQNKFDEERLLRKLDDLRERDEVDQRWLAIARTQIEQGFMALNRAIFQPARIPIPDDVVARATIDISDLDPKDVAWIKPAEGAE
jgi:hypothetical protein